MEETAFAFGQHCDLPDAISSLTSLTAVSAAAHQPLPEGPRQTAAAGYVSARGLVRAASVCDRYVLSTSPSNLKCVSVMDAEMLSY